VRTRYGQSQAKRSARQQVWATPVIPEAESVSGDLQVGLRVALQADLQARAAPNLRLHMWRATMRVCTLVITDLGAFLLLRTALRALRELHFLGAPASSFLQWLFAHGYLGGWQFAVALLVSLIVTGNYGPGDHRRDPGRLLTACALATALPLWSSLWSAPLLLTATRYVLTVVPACAVLLAVRLLYDQLVARFAPHPHAAAVARTILVGHAGECIDMRGRKALTERSGFDVVGFVDVQTPPARGALGALGDLERILLEHRVDTVVLCGFSDDNTAVRVVRAAMTAECRVLSAARRFELAGVRPAIIWRRGQPFIELRAVALRWQQLFFKRLLDVTVAAVALILLSPLLLAIAAAVRLGSKGRAIFGHRRLGRHGRVFTCYKFRSMYADAEERLQTDPELYGLYVENDYKLPDAVDTRITPVGRFLRRTSLDELPQLWNVLKGEMSLVGPRPIVPEEIRHYNGEAPLLLALQPGITGAWQVNGRSLLQYPERATVELEYVERWSLLRDVWILVRTVPAVLGRRGAH
jgi:exopolysaccharide biosynthesis polyprenyl glycosylphosphotransferase